VNRAPCKRFIIRIPIYEETTSKVRFQPILGRYLTRLQWHHYWVVHTPADRLDRPQSQRPSSLPSATCPCSWFEMSIKHHRGRLIVSFPIAAAAAAAARLQRPSSSLHPHLPLWNCPLLRWSTPDAHTSVALPQKPLLGIRSVIISSKLNDTSKSLNGSPHGGASGQGLGGRHHWAYIGRSVISVSNVVYTDSLVADTCCPLPPCRRTARWRQMSGRTRLVFLSESLKS